METKIVKYLESTKEIAAGSTNVEDQIKLLTDAGWYVIRREHHIVPAYEVPVNGSQRALHFPQVLVIVTFERNLENVQ